MNSKIIIYQILCVFRIALILVPQSGYVHPDEHFQASEIVYGDIAGYKVLRTWDFSSSKPIRSIIFPYSVAVVPAIIVHLLKLFNFKINSYVLLILPRLLMCAYSFIQDFCIYQICNIMNMDYKPSLMLFASSYVTFIYFTRTFSNSLESVLFTLFLLFSFKSLKLFQKVNGDEIHIFLNKFTFYSFISSIILVGGCFIRPTFLCFAVFPMIIWCFILYRINIFAKINILLSIILGASSMCVCLTAIDTFYYNKVHYSAITNFNIISTPINFVFYNLNPANLHDHGLHPRWLHALVNVPLLFSIYGIILLFYFLVKNFYLFKVVCNPFEKFLILSFVGPLLLLSLIPHQEPRFIIPLIIPLSLICNFKYLRTHSSNRFYICIWICCNILSLLFYGFIHQAGVYLSINYLNNVVESRNVVIFYKNYMPPRYLFHLNKSSSAIGIYDFTEFEIDEFESRTQDIIMNNKPLKVFIVLPYTVLHSDLTFEVLTISGYKFSKKMTIFPHLSSENLPSFSNLFHILQKNALFIDKLNEIMELYSIHIVLFQKYYN